MNEGEFGIVVVHWRGMADTLACLRSLASLQYEAKRIALVVNGSQDFEADALAATALKVEIVHCDGNLGYAGGCNAGARAVLAGGRPEFLLFLNNDVTLAPHTLARFRDAFASEPRAGIVGGVVTYADDPHRVWFAGGTIHRAFGYTRHIGFGSREMPQAARYVDFINGAALAIRTDVFDALAGFDEAYFHYFEDTDLSQRARRAGYGSFVVSEPLVRHRISASAGEAGSNRLNSDQAYYFSRNRVRFIARNFRGWRRAFAIAAQIALLLPYEAGKALLARNPAEAIGRSLGVIDGLRARTGRRR